MSANNIFFAPDAVHVFTDGASVAGPDVKLVKLGSKISHLIGPNFFAVTSTTGPEFVGKTIAMALQEEQFDDLESVIARFGDVIRRAQTLMEASAPTLEWGVFRAAIAGWCLNQGKPMGVSVKSDAYQPIEITGEYIDPAVGLSFDPSNIAESGVRIMSNQRWRKWRLRGGDKLGSHLIGGFCQHTTVTRDEISTRILKRWPEDKIGEPILAPVAEKGTFTKTDPAALWSLTSSTVQRSRP